MEKNKYSYLLGNPIISRRIADFIKNHPTQNIPVIKSINNCVLIVLDELTGYHNLPPQFLKLLKGYQMMSKIGVEFTNIHCNRQACSASRSSYTTSQINTGIQDNIDQSYQYTYVDSIPSNFDTFAKSLKKKYGDNIFTAQFGKDHLQSKLTTTVNTVPLWNINTSGCLKQYGFDRYNVFGDPYYNRNNGLFSDDMTFEFKRNTTTVNVDYIDKQNNTGYIGALPFLKSRAIDKKQFFASINFINPHDTQEFWSNLSQTPTNKQMTFWVPYLDEQVSEAGITSPYKYSNQFTDAYCKNINLTTNYFKLLYPNQETSYEDYKNNLNSLPFKNSYENDYVMSSKTNNLFPYFIGTHQGLVSIFSGANDNTDIKSWKNLINNYYGLIYESDIYIYKLLLFLKNSNMLQNTSIIITSDHGDTMSAHGLKQKQTHYKENINVPFLVYSPYFNKSIIGSKSNILGSLLDLAPTINTLTKNDVNTNFSGTSLFNWNNSKLTIRTLNIPVLNVYNSWMTSTNAYIGYQLYVSGLNQEQLDTIVCKPNGFFQFLCNFIITIGYYKGKLYKFVRYYNLYEVLRYNSLYNSILIGNCIYTCVNDDFQTRYIDDLSTDFQNTYSSEITYITDIITTNDTNDGNTDFETIFGLINSDPDNTDSVNLTTFVYITILYINKLNTNMSYVIPGRYSTFDDIKTNVNYYHYCHNITDDPEEVINMFDSKNYNSSYDELFNFYHIQMNNQIHQYNMNNYTFIIPQPIIYLFLSAIKSYGSDFSSYSSEDLNNLMTYNGENNFDAP